jgi:hypothetical protein
VLEIPNAITKQVRDICELVEANPVNIKTADAARLTGMNVATYRAAALRGQIPFAIGAKRTADGNGCIKTLTLPFFLAMMNMNGLDLLKGMNA